MSQNNIGKKYTNELINTASVKSARAEIEIVVRKNGRVIYRNKAYGVIFNVLQSDLKLDTKTGIMEGDSQTLAAGTPLEILFLWDQWRQKLAPIIQKAKLVYFSLLQREKKQN